MQLIIDRAIGTVTINGTMHVVDVSSVQPEIARIVWLDDHGTVTYSDGRTSGIGDIFKFKAVIDAWHERHNALRAR